MGEASMNEAIMSKDALQALSPEALDALERKIAGRHMHRIPWGAVAWGLGGSVHAAQCSRAFNLYQKILI